ncbi:hypothetical protein [Lacticaseibacillus saniviri]|uniref:hypothetical protein n=1 Tax=Lacticaseibacillus saniviri TaxID=931533 RepID=UPI000A81C6C9|nr:hypothetical protein [Lacticaseibacillus saniviri]
MSDTVLVTLISTAGGILLALAKGFNDRRLLKLKKELHDKEIDEDDDDSKTE